MLGKLIIPVINTEKKDFKYNGTLDRETYDNMVMETFIKNDKKIQKLTDSMKNGYAFDFGDRKIVNYDVENDIDFLEAETLFLNAQKKDYDVQNLEKIADNGKMTILLININPNDIKSDAESELKYWLRDSQMILGDKDLTDKVKLENLPKMNFYIETEEGKKYLLDGCKMFEEYSNEKWPYYFALIINKIKKVEKYV